MRAMIILLLSTVLGGCALPVVNLGGTTNIVIVQKYNRDGTMTSTTQADEANPATTQLTATLPKP